MRRIFTAAAVFFGLTFATGLVLPFGGPGGNAVSLALSQSLGTVSPFVAELAFPETPWPQGWSLVMGDPDGPGGARIAAEATGADWVLVGKVEDGGWISAYLRYNGQTLPARFASADLLASWTALQLGITARPATVYEELDGPLLELMETAPHFDPETYLNELSPAAGKVLKEQTLLVNGLYAHGPSSYAKLLPAAMVDYWAHRQEPEKMSDEGMGPVWKAFFPIMNDDVQEANKRAKSLLDSDRALDVAGALLVLRATKDPGWRTAAARLTKIAPELTFGWEELSFAAFEEDNAALAKTALQKAIDLEPDSSLYWTNLGWAEYMLGDYPRAVFASLRGLELEPNPVAAYNLGLLFALQGDYADAFDYYRTALRLDEGTEVQMAIKDIGDTGKSEMLFWKGYLLARSGRWQEARAAYEAFIRENPSHRLVEEARKELEGLERIKLDISISGYHLGPLAVTPPFGVHEKISPTLQATANAYLPSSEAVCKIYRGDKQVAQSVTQLTIPPLTTEFARDLNPFQIAEPGTYRMVVEYAGEKYETSFDVGPTHLGRQLLSLGIVPVDLDGNPLVPEDVLAGPHGEEDLIEATLKAIHEAAPQAREIERFSTPLTNGPFEGKTVAEIMENATADTIRQFYEYSLANPDLLSELDAINAFANWIIAAP